MPELAEFEGAWQLWREIDDLRAGARGRFEGIARFTPHGDGLAYAEEGMLHLPDQPPMQATRRYVWRPDAGGIAVFFEDGRLFHRIGPGPAPQARHDCAPDVYAVRYDFAAWPEWRATWQVRGPRKHYEMHSRYRYRGRI